MFALKQNIRGIYQQNLAIDKVIDFAILNIVNLTALSVFRDGSFFYGK
ncbi:hypothetical protein KAW43_00275 [Candidatus Parcubacteria bacterium]|nr:hypothetical protein [Candidatus Parcubacteria bacterium]